MHNTNIVITNGKTKTRAAYTEVSIISYNLPNSPKHQGWFLENMTSSEGGQLLVGAFQAVMDKIEAGILQIP